MAHMSPAPPQPDPMETSDCIFRGRTTDMGRFFNISDIELLRQIHLEFRPELDRLKRAYSIRERHVPLLASPSPSQIIYETQHDEVNRTLVSVLSLRWIYRDQYELFTRTQPDQVILSRSSFTWLRDIVLERLQNPTDLYALLTYIVINDLGKDPQLASDYLSQRDEDISGLNHDIILFKAAEAGMIPSFNRLQEQNQDEILRGMRLGAEFNPGQLAQAENAPACLLSLLQMKGHSRSFRFHFIQQLLDISGAAGHEDWTCAKKFIQPIAKAYQDVYEVAEAIISGERGLRDAYDVILVRRGNMLHEKGLGELDVQRHDHRAFLRLLCMGGVSDLDKADFYLSVWEKLEDDTKSSLIHTLNVDGSFSEPAVQPTYMPAMLTQGVGEVDSAPREIRTQRLRHILRYLSRVMNLESEWPDHTAVVERSVLWVLKGVVQSDAFREDPTILESTKIPETAILVLM